MRMTIDLTEKEQEIIWRATKHRKKICGHGLMFRDMLNKILVEHDEELNIIENDLNAESK